jgi:hypothetical protein
MRVWLIMYLTKEETSMNDIDITSNCCGSYLIDPSGENKEGRCGDCKEMAAAVIGIPITQTIEEVQISVSIK